MVETHVEEIHILAQNKSFQSVVHSQKLEATYRSGLSDSGGPGGP